MRTKREIQKILKERFNVEVTLRPRKATLERILKNEVAKSTKAGCSGWHPVEPTTEEWMEFTKVEPMDNPHERTAWIIFYGFLASVVFLTGLGVTGRILEWIV